MVYFIDGDSQIFSFNPDHMPAFTKIVMHGHPGPASYQIGRLNLATAMQMRLMTIFSTTHSYITTLHVKQIDCFNHGVITLVAFWFQRLIE